VEEGLKKRLLGAAVLASLAVIFVPMLIEEPGVSEPEIREIPAPPPREDFASSMLREEVVRPEPVRVDIPAPESSDPDPPPQAVTPAEQPSPPPKPEVTPKVGLSAWVVQVGSFSNLENAENLIATLRKAGFQAPDPERIELRGETRYRVRVGPMVQKEKAEQLLPKINQVSGTQGLVVRYP